MEDALCAIDIRESTISALMRKLEAAGITDISREQVEDLYTAVVTAFEIAKPVGIALWEEAKRIMQMSDDELHAKVFEIKEKLEALNAESETT